jgi:hypothetical protein
MQWTQQLETTSHRVSTHTNSQFNKLTPPGNQPHPRITTPVPPCTAATRPHALHQHAPLSLQYSPSFFTDSTVGHNDSNQIKSRTVTPPHTACPSGQARRRAHDLNQREYQGAAYLWQRPGSQYSRWASWVRPTSTAQHRGRPYLRLLHR